MEAVSHTSQWTAAARALETEREDALFRDELARPLASETGFELLRKYGGGGLADFVSIRTRYLDDAIEAQVLGGGIRQVVLIAAGMDARAFRLGWPKDAVVYEVDHSALFEVKESRLAALGAAPAVDRRVVGADLTKPWLSTLEAAGFDRNKPTLWVAEALLFFLTDEQVRSLLDLLAEGSAPGSRLALDVLSETLLNSIGTQIFLGALKADGIPWLFGTDDPEAYFAKSGWHITRLDEPGQQGAGAGRWPYEVFPREVPNVPRNWLIQADFRG
ncbi:SAM-dependent methyltransferase [Kitasatospora kifunensis]|uniref:S-adenosyl-L-methionine-dependent methyltransferase n=1 Tax=Kitasatospora kifunensis TaxID=58351 RepID=A0A7W7R8V1_KITKI|nr:SAM-dependent methyltransferase [Kitasatospora kifunensis]MBB4927410.1 methyltransferase (TIGR00027 family) [Kitasatospora kifunensis]